VISLRTAVSFAADFCKRFDERIAKVAAVRIDGDKFIDSARNLIKGSFERVIGQTLLCNPSCAGSRNANCSRGKPFQRQPQRQGEYRGPGLERTSSAILHYLRNLQIHQLGILSKWSPHRLMPGGDSTR
jgi:hypothetical protein